ncbi:MAG: TetR/AcrR family transcriptional regulator, partial [Chloroflexota bacterium]|nr:TetR/AcrR family transcriptional regulator [Chloroflexota bacterium]
MTERAETTVRTQQRIVRAAVRLHARNGVRATRWDDIAATARTGRATVYRHFPDLAALVPACARAVFAAIDLPDA